MSILFFRLFQSKTVYYFVKPNINKFTLDADTVRRLADEFTVSHKAEIDNGKELSIVNDWFWVRVLYSSGPGLYQVAIENLHQSPQKNLPLPPGVFLPPLQGGAKITPGGQIFRPPWAKF